MYRSFRTANFDCSGEQFLIGTFPTESQAKAKNDSDASSFPQCGHTIEKDENGVTAVISTVNGEQPEEVKGE